MRGGEYDAIAPTFGSNLLPLKSASGITFNQIPGYFQEHIDMQFGKWNYNPTKAKALIAKHCTGSGAPVTCSGLPAKFRYTWTASNATRTNQEAIAKAELKDLGIEIVDA